MNRRGIALAGFLAFLLLAAIAGSDAAERGELPAAAAAQDWSLVEDLVGQGVEVDQAVADGMTALHYAVQFAHEPTVAMLLKSGADAGSATDYGITPLAIACGVNNARNVELLLEAGASTEQILPGETTLLMIASRTGNPDIVRLLSKSYDSLDAQERQGQTALMWAAAEGNLQAVEVLLEAGADPDIESENGFTAMMFAVREGRIEVARALLSHGVDVSFAMQPEKGGKRIPRKGTSALIMAVESGHFELAMMLVEQGADPNDLRSGFSPLHTLTNVRKPKWGEEPDGDPPRRGSGSMTDLQFVRAIVAAGADVNLQLERGQSGKAILGHKGATPVLMAGKTCDLPYLQLLVELGADPKIPNAEGCTGLMAAAGVGVRAVGEEPGSIEEVCAAIDFFMEHGVDVNSRDENGETAMHGAAYRNFPEVVEYLASRGADPGVWDQKNKWGWTPVMIAQGKRPGSFKPSPETVAALREAGAE